jgi:Cof subfamily protein (haloacid dehalogenase superfamily)
MARRKKLADKGEVVRSSEALAFDLVGLDVDGTLLNSEHEVPHENAEAIKAARSAGVLVTLVTGRSTFSLRPVLEQFEIDIPYICSGGAEIIDPTAGKSIDRRIITRSDLELIVTTVREFNAAMFFTLSDGIYYEAPPGSLDDWKPSRSFHLTETEDILSENHAEPVKVALYGDPDKLARIETTIRHHEYSVHMGYPLGTFLDITREDANKGAALIRLANLLKVPMERTLVMGDADNDLSMFDVAGMSIAMGNAAPQVKAAADRIAPSNDENGVAWALREIVLGERIGG